MQIGRTALTTAGLSVALWLGAAAVANGAVTTIADRNDVPHAFDVRSATLSTSPSGQLTFTVRSWSSMAARTGHMCVIVQQGTTTYDICNSTIRKQGLLPSRPVAVGRAAYRRYAYSMVFSFNRGVFGPAPIMGWQVNGMCPGCRVDRAPNVALVVGTL